jgi:hypothetical protein
VNPAWHMAGLPFSLLSIPSQFQVWEHVRRCATANPWLPDTSNFDAVR